MHRRKQGPKDDDKPLSEATPAITFALLSVSLTDAKGIFFWLSLLMLLSPDLSSKSYGNVQNNFSREKCAAWAP